MFERWAEDIDQLILFDPPIHQLSRNPISAYRKCATQKCHWAEVRLTYFLTKNHDLKGHDKI